MKKTSVLLSSSDPNLGVVLSEYLRLRDFQVELSGSAPEAFNALSGGAYDFCLLALDDVQQLLELVADIRRTSDVPIFVLRNSFDKDEQVALYTAGADDCLLQPVIPEILICKMKAMSLRWNHFLDLQPTSFSFPDFCFDSVAQTLSVGGMTFHLSTKETGVMLLLCQHANQLVERSRILKDVWLADNYFNARSLSVYINRLRHYIEPNSKLRIVSMRLRGYKLLVP